MAFKDVILHMKYSILFLIIVASFNQIKAQVQLNFDLITENDFSFEVEVYVDSNVDYQIRKLPFYTAVSFASIIPISWNEIRIINEDGTQTAMKANHEDSVDSQFMHFTNLYHITIPKQEINLSIKNYSGIIRIRGVYAPPLTIPENNAPQQINGCLQPEWVSQHVWRSGLPAPAIIPASTIVKHVIIHHSAGSNTDTNYTQTIRNIYLYHTQSNGWDDIGYNFLIAPNGVLYAGRDPQGVADQDNIRGAHFCSKNTNTMGICMLGTYTQTVPNQIAIDMLEDLLTWKMEKSYLNPIHFDLHPLGSSDALNTGIIDGHQAGCNTECPGTVFYQAFPQLRNNVLAKLQACGGIIASSNINPTNIQINLFAQGDVLYIKSDLEISHWHLLDLQGKILAQGDNLSKESTLMLKSYSTGVYFIKLQTVDGSLIAKKFVKQ